jgi:hypothetical protein
VLSEGFVDHPGTKAVLTDLELSGVSLSDRRTEVILRASGRAGRSGTMGRHESTEISDIWAADDRDRQGGEKSISGPGIPPRKDALIIPVLHFYKIISLDTRSGQEPLPDNLKGHRGKRLGQS